jgi:transketolase
MDDLKKFRQLDSKCDIFNPERVDAAHRTPGHPEVFMTDGVEVCTGPLGQGLIKFDCELTEKRHLECCRNGRCRSALGRHIQSSRIPRD